MALSLRLSWLGTLAFAAPLLSSSSASACICPDQIRLFSPTPSATGVSRRPNIVVSASFPLVHARTQVQLLAPDGSSVPLEPTGHPDLTGGSVCEATYRFVRPALPLEPNTRYTVHFEYEDEQLRPEKLQDATFTTGDAPQEPAAPPRAALSFDLLRRSPTCEPDSVTCQDLVRPSLEPLVNARGWLRIREAAAPSNEQLIAVGAVPEPEPNLLFPLAGDEHCLDYEWIDLAGATVDSGAVCEPRACAQLGPTASIERGLCGAGYHWSGPAELGSCNDPPLIEGAPGSGEPDGAAAPADAGADRRSRSSEAHTCSVRLAQPRAGWVALLASLVLLLLDRRRVRTR